MRTAELKLNQKQREIIIGLLLGDGHLETQNQGKTYRLKIEHSSKQSDYVDWLYNQFSEWVLTPPQTKIQTVRGKKYYKYWFNTVSHGALRFYAKQFYRQRKKVVPQQISHWLTPLSMAIWFMDDGSRKSDKHKDFLLNTQSFSPNSLLRLQEAILKNFSLTTALRKQREGKQIWFQAAAAIQLKNLIAPLVIPAMNYKLDNTMPKT